MATSVIRFNDFAASKYFIESSVFLAFSILINRLGVAGNTPLLIPNVYIFPLKENVKLNNAFYLLQGVQEGPNALKRFMKISSFSHDIQSLIDRRYPITIVSDDPFLSLFDATFYLDINDPPSWRLAIIANELKRRQISSNQGNHKLTISISDYWNYTISYEEHVLVMLNSEQKKIEIHDHYLTNSIQKSFLRVDEHSLMILNQLNVKEMVSANDGGIVVQC